MLTFTFQPIAYRPSLTFEFRQPGLYCTASVVLDDAVGSAECEFDVNILRKLTASALINYEQGQAVTDNLHIITQQAQFNSASVLCEHQKGQLIIVETVSDLQQMTLTRIEHHTAQQQAQLLIQRFCSLLNISVLINRHFCFTEQDGVLLSNGIQSVQDVLEFITTQAHDNKQQALQQLVKLCINTPYSLFISKRFCDLKQQAKPPPFGKSPHIDRPRPPPEPQPPDHVTITIPTKEAYTVQHVIDVKTVIGNHPVPLSKISLNYDVDAFCWSFSGVLADKNALSLVIMNNDTPIQLSITINGHNWIVLVEKIPETRRFAQTDITLQGRSLSALLGAPYQMLSSYTAGSDMTVQQIADSLLPFGWSIDWQCATPWLIPANTYSYTQQTRLQALAKLAQDIGAVLLPSPNEQVLTIQPRYPILPWNYYTPGIDADLVIPDDAIESIGVESRTQSPINAVYVHGDQNGVLAWCRLNGTAGDVLAPTESNALITDVTAARALGERILAGHSTQPVTTSLTTWLGGDFPLAKIGWLLEANNERAIINSVAISVELGKVRQTIGVGENTTNPYSKLLNLLPAQPLLVGELVSSFDGKSILTLLDGGVITARGNGVVGANYYVRNGLIESVAPDLGLLELVF